MNNLGVFKKSLKRSIHHNNYYYYCYKLYIYKLSVLHITIKIQSKSKIPESIMVCWTIPHLLR